jgi:hypothetical protein
MESVALGERIEVTEEEAIIGPLLASGAGTMGAALRRITDGDDVNASQPTILVGGLLWRRH